VSVSFARRPGEARVEQKVRIANETPVEARYLYWSNCGVPADGDSEFIYPEKSGSLHGDYINSVSWPYYDKTNIALVKNLDEMLGLYMLDAKEGYFGCYNHQNRNGVLHYADVNDLPGKKTWTWGWHKDAQHTASTHSDNEQCYIEIQGGRITIQEELERIMPMSSAEWTEYWFPYSDIGIVNGVSADAAINFHINASTDKQSIAEIKLFANRNFENLGIVLWRGDEKLKTVPLKSLTAGQPQTVYISLDCSVHDCKNIAVVILNSTNSVIVSALPEVMRKQEKDSFFTPDVMPENKAENFTAEGIFSKAEILLKDWFEHMPEIKSLLNESLEVDPGFSRAHVELGLICLKGGQFEIALEHFNKALERIVDDGRTIYYKGLSLWLLGRIQEARAALRRASRFGYECQERVMEAIIAINQNDPNDAYEQLKQAERSGGGVLLIKVLKSILLHRDGRNAEASSVIDEAQKITPDNPFIYCIRYLLNENSSELKRQIIDIYSGLQSEILEVIAVLSFAGLNHEAYTLFDLIDTSNEITELYRTHLEQHLGIAATALLPTGGTADFAWRMEEFMILQQAISINPQHAENYFHLGNFYYGHGFYVEGIKAWEQAMNKGLSSPRLSYQLFRAYKKNGDIARANQYIREAFSMDSRDPYIFDDYAEMIFTVKGVNGGIEFLEENLSTAIKYFTSMHKLLSSYVEIEDYDKLEKTLQKISFRDFWRNSFGKYWVILKQAKGYLELRNNNFTAAHKFFNESSRIPDNVSGHYLLTLPQQARRMFYLGLCHAKLGDNANATECWEAALEIKILPRFEISSKFTLACTRMFHVFALKGLNRNSEAEICMQYIKVSALNPNFLDSAKKSLLKLGSMAEKYDIDDFDKFDTATGIASNLSMASSVED